MFPDSLVITVLAGTVTDIEPVDVTIGDEVVTSVGSPASKLPYP